MSLCILSLSFFPLACVFVNFFANKRIALHKRNAKRLFRDYYIMDFLFILRARHWSSVCLVPWICLLLLDFSSQPVLNSSNREKSMYRYSPFISLDAGPDKLSLQIYFLAIQLSKYVVIAYARNTFLIQTLDYIWIALGPLGTPEGHICWLGLNPLGWFLWHASPKIEITHQSWG